MKMSKLAKIFAIGACFGWVGEGFFSETGTILVTSTIAGVPTSASRELKRSLTSPSILPTSVPASTMITLGVSAFDGDSASFISNKNKIDYTIDFNSSKLGTIKSIYNSTDQNLRFGSTNTNAIYQTKFSSSIAKSFGLSQNDESIIAFGNDSNVPILIFSSPELFAANIKIRINLAFIIRVLLLINNNTNSKNELNSKMLNEKFALEKIVPLQSSRGDKAGVSFKFNNVFFDYNGVRYYLKMTIETENAIPGSTAPFNVKNIHFSLIK